MIRQGSRVYINTPAKLNLFLELTGRRADGYHELETLMVPINLYDHVSVAPLNDSPEIRFQCDWASGTEKEHLIDLPDYKGNVAYQAVQRLQQESSIQAGAEVRLVKRIPAQAGLGGGSSDAAAALVAANEAWQLNWSRERLAGLAASLGSDVPFFLWNTLSRCTGRGEKIEPLPTAGRYSFVLIKPTEGLSTPAVFKVSQISDRPRDSEQIIAALRAMNPVQLGHSLFNRLQSAAEKLTNWIGIISRAMDQFGVCGHQMSGSGTSYFGVCRNHRHARHVAARLRATQLGQVFVASTLGPTQAH